MVREKKRKKKAINQDFKRVKAKVGRKIDKTKSKYGNQTDTSFRSKSLNLKEQLVDSTSVKIKIAKFLPLTTHHNASTRAGALKGLTEIINDVYHGYGDRFSRSVLPLVVERARECVTDEDKGVRTALVALMTSLLEIDRRSDTNDAEAIHWFFPFVKIFVFHVCAALNSLSLGTRLHALALIDLLLKYFPGALCNGFEEKLVISYNTLLNNTIENVGNRTTNNLSGNGKVDTKNSKNTDKVKTPNWYKVASSFENLITAISKQKRNFVTDKNSESSNLEISSRYNDYDPKLFYYVEAKPAQSISIDAPTSPLITVRLYENVVSTCSKLWIQAGAQLETKPNSSSDAGMLSASSNRKRIKRSKRTQASSTCIASKKIGLADITQLVAAAKLLKCALKHYLDERIVLADKNLSDGDKIKNQELMERTRKLLISRFPIRLDDALSRDQNSDIGLLNLEVNCNICESIIYTDQNNIKRDDFVNDFKTITDWLCTSLLKMSSSKNQNSNKIERLMQSFLLLLPQMHDGVAELCESRIKMLETFNQCFVNSINTPTSTEIMEIFIKELVGITNESLKKTSLFGSMESLLMVLPRTIWQLSSYESGNEENQHKANLLCEKVLRVLLECVSVDATIYNPDVWAKIANKITALFYVQTKSSGKKLLGPFLNMSTQCQKLTLHVITMLPSETLPESILKGIAICAHVLVWQTAFDSHKGEIPVDGKILPDLLRTPFLRDERYMPLDDLLSYAVTVLWGFDANLYSDLGVFDNIDLKANKDIIKKQHATEVNKVHNMIYGMLQQVSSSRCINVFTYMVPILESLTLSQVCPDYMKLLSRSFNDKGSDNLNFELMCDFARAHSFLSCVYEQNRKSNQPHVGFLESKLARVFADLLVCQMYVANDRGFEFFSLISPTHTLITDTVCELLEKGGKVSFEVALSWTEALHSILTSTEQIDTTKRLNAKKVLDSLKASVTSDKESESIVDRIVSELSLWGVK